MFNGSQNKMRAFKKLIRELAFTDHSSLDALVNLAAAVQKLRVRHPDPERRSDSPTLTRSSVLYAICELDPDVRDVFAKAGLDWAAFQKALGIETTPARRRRKDARADDSLRDSLLRLRDLYPDQSQSMKLLPGIALAITESLIADPKLGKLPVRLAELGVDLPRARSQLAVLALWLTQLEVLIQEEDLLLEHKESTSGTKPPHRPKPAGVTKSSDAGLDSEASANHGETYPKNAERSDEASFYSSLHHRPRPRAALCLSGGGIRSATFSLGVLQGLARMGALKRFDFLSTVSGGGFIGSWLSRWIYESGSIDKVSVCLAADTPNIEPVNNLRESSSYLSPKRGMSRDSFTLAAIVFRNFILTWLVIIPLLLAILMIPRLAVTAFGTDPIPGGWWPGFGLILLVPVWYVLRHRYYATTLSSQTTFTTGVLPLVVAVILSCFWEPLRSLSGCFPPDGTLTCSNGAIDLVLYTILAIPALLIGFVVIYGLIQGFLSRSTFTGEQGRERSSRDSAALLSLSAGWLVLSATVLLGPVVLLKSLHSAPGWIAGIGGLAGASTALIGFFGHGGGATEPSKTSHSWRGWLQRNLLPITAGVFLLLFTTGLSLTTSWALSKTIPPDEQLSIQTKQPSQDSTKDSLLAWFDSLDNYLGLFSGDEPPPDEELIMREATRPAKIAQVRSALEEFPAPLTRLQTKVRQLQNTHELSLISSVSNNVSARLAGWIAFFALLLMSMACTALFGVNRFSLHALYGNRLIRAYLAAARPRNRRTPDPATGFDPNDDLTMAKLKSLRPLHIVNAALNLSGGSDQARQSRKGASFTFSALHSGSESTGFVASGAFSSPNGISQGKAMTISGAAVSPAMGYHSSKLVGAVLMLFNARLGWWLPNPKRASRNVWRKREPTFGFWPIVREFLGRANDKCSFVYVSDGGHFENLGLYEMVRRRCLRIVVVDAGQDVKNNFESLSTAIRMVRVDFGIDISFDPNDGPLTGRELKKHYSLGRIDYSAVDGPGAKNGVIVYIKPALLGDEPMDVTYYAAMRRKAGAIFPQETTADQFFDEAQFESYRKLGLASVQALQKDHPYLDGIPVPEPVAPRRVSAVAKVTSVTVTAQQGQGAATGISKLAESFSSQASNWIAPAVASTVAASAVVAFTVTVVGPESIRLAPPPEPVQLQVDAMNVTADVDLNDDAEETLKQAMNKSDKEKGGIQFGEDVRDTLKKAMTPDEEEGGIQFGRDVRDTLVKATSPSDGLTLNSTTATKLNEVTSDKKGIRINKEDLDALEITAKILGDPSIAKTLESVVDELGSANRTLDRIDTKLDGLRNDSGVVQ